MFWYDWFVDKIKGDCCVFINIKVNFNVNNCLDKFLGFMLSFCIVWLENKYFKFMFDRWGFGSWGRLLDFGLYIYIFFLVDGWYIFVMFVVDLIIWLMSLEVFIIIFFWENV